MKYQTLFFSKDKSKNFKCRLLQFSFGALRVNKTYAQVRTIFSNNKIPKDRGLFIQTWKTDPSVRIRACACLCNTFQKTPF